MPASTRRIPETGGLSGAQDPATDSVGVNMAVSETAPMPRAKTQARGVRAALAAAWDARPDWARDRMVLGLAGSLLALLVLFFLALGFLQADQPGRQLTLDQLNRLAGRGQIVSL